MKTNLVALIALLGLAASASARPNVLFFLTDDQRADTIAALGNPAIHTPQFDKLARRGFCFSNAYCLGANMAAVCRPSRNMLLSGRAYFRWPGKNNAPADKPNFPDAMRAAGYETYHCGKRGNSADEIQKRFDHNLYLNEDKARNSGEHGQELVDNAITFLRERKSDKPFFMYLACEGPHDPRVAAKKYLEQYVRDEIPLPKNFLPLHPFNNGWMAGRDEALEKWPRTPEAVKRHLHDYYACITSIDGHFGRLLAELKELGQLDHTIIVFSSDHGLALGSHGLFGKQNLYEDGMKAPLIIAGPGIPAGRSAALVYLHDIFPSVCELVGADVPAKLDGRSFVTVVEGRQKKMRDSLFLAFENSQRAVRDERFKIIRYPQINKTQLFDLEKDPHEIKDLAADASHAGRIESLLTTMRNWQKELGDAQPLSIDKPLDPNWTPPASSPKK